jgi:uridine kinase
VSVLTIGVAGGSGSGKTTIARAIVEMLPTESVALLEHDHYYKDNSHLSYEERTRINYDHPDALDNEMFIAHLDTLRQSRAIDKPVYDFAQHNRAKDTVRVEPAPVIVVEGILVLTEAELRARMDVKLFVDTDSDIRVMRRIRRDLEQRGRTFAQIRQQYYDTVRPMHLAFVEPSKRFADMIIPEGGKNQVALDMIVNHVQRFLQRRGAM